MPLPISLDPTRRGEWETKLARSSSKPVSAKPSSGTVSASASHPSAETEPPQASPVTSGRAPTGPPAAPALASSADLPPLESDETHASTSYKARIIGRHIGERVEKHKKEGKKGPLMVGLQGPQGCGE